MEDDKRRGYRVKQVFDQETLKRFESRCHEEDSPGCRSMCPLHMDGRQFCAHLAAGRLDDARKQYEKEVPLPHLTALLCHAPCRADCKRAEVDAPLQMRALEAAVMAHGNAPRAAKRRLRGRKKGAVAVLGAGLTGIVAAATLAEKGFEVQVFDTAAEPGGALLPALQDASLQAAWETDWAAVFATDGITFHFNATAQTAETFSALQAQFGALFVSTTVLAALQLGAPNAVTFEVVAGVFSVPEHPLPESYIDVVAEARRAAWSIDRYMQGTNISLTSGRELEGAYRTELYTDTSQAPPEVVSLLSQVPSREDAVAEARRCLDCHCLVCKRACAYLRHYDTYPKRLIRTVYNNISIVAGNRTANRQINSCTLCGQCQDLCPTDIDVVQVVRNARENMVETHKMPPSTHEFALLDMAHSRSEAYHLARSPVATPQYAYFPGCQMGALMPETLLASYADLEQRMDGGVALMLDCCGAVADWAGDAAQYQQALARIEADWQHLGQPTLIVACPTCYRNFSDMLPHVPLCGIWDMLPEASEFVATPFMLQEPCTLRSMPQTYDAIRARLRESGLPFTLAPYAGTAAGCCGYGGLVKYANPDVARAFAEDLLPHEKQTVLTTCVNCRDQALRAGGTAVHFLECHYGEQPLQPAHLGARRYHREYVRAEVLRRYWKEDTVLSTPDRTLLYDEGVQTHMEDRWIMDRDLHAVLDVALAEDMVIIDEKTGHHFANARIGKVTYWVVFTPEADAVRIHDAYSHRMLIEEV